MRHSFLIIFLLTFLFACTKEVPEAEKKIVKTVDENLIREIVENYVTAYNTGEIETAVTFFDPEYNSITADSDDVIGIEALRNDLSQFHQAYPEGKWDIKIEEIHIQSELAYIITTGSLLMPNPIEHKAIPSYSERSLKILKKTQNGEWKIYRSISVPAYSYD